MDYSKKTHWLTHRRFNDLLTLIVLLTGIYLIASPFSPQITAALDRPPQATTALPVQRTISAEPTLLIPRLGMTEKVHTGTSPSELSKGAWLVPKTSTPDKESNTVIVGHRFTYAGPDVFYFLDKVQVGDTLYVDWQGKEYRYKVDRIRVVPATEISVHAPTSEPQLTLYTCTPLWSAKDRLVITAPLVGVRS